ncbi:MAG: 1,6-anhydro-N-acetylmuramyl-L-alanine amidase AmpD [Burkholderiales bacterium]
MLKLNSKANWSKSGVLYRARQCPSPNQDARPEAMTVDLVVVHGISLPPGEFRGAAIEKLFTNRLDGAAHPSFATLRGIRVSAHFLIRRGGALIQFVACDRRAWHAGISAWDGRERCNDFSIGIELEGTDNQPYTTAQYRQLVLLCVQIVGRYPVAHFVGHSDIAPGRKTDPGPAFRWELFRSMLDTRTRSESIRHSLSRK